MLLLLAITILVLPFSETNETCDFSSAPSMKDYVVQNGVPLMEYRIYESEAYFYEPLSDAQSAFIDDDSFFAHVTDVPVGITPLSSDTSIRESCPCLTEHVIANDLWRATQFSDRPRYYPILMPDEEAPWYMDNLETRILLSPKLGYCGANYPVVEQLIDEDVNLTVRYPPRPELLPTLDENTKIIGYIWKYPPFLNEDDERLDSELITMMQRPLFRISTEPTTNYQNAYTFGINYQQNYLSKGYIAQSVVGLVGPYRMTEDLLKQCPLLYRIKLFKTHSFANTGRKEVVSWIGESRPYDDGYESTDYDETNAFYCAPYMGYCGAYLKLQRLRSKKKNWNSLITTDDLEAEAIFKTPQFAIKSPKPQTVCWIWYPHEPTMKMLFSEASNAIINANVRLFSGVFNTGQNVGFHRYSTNEAAFTSDFDIEGQIGRLALEGSVSNTTCPLLLKLNMYNEQGGNRRTFIGALEDLTSNFRLDTNGKWNLHTTFYCAPYGGYCGATKLLFAIMSWDRYQDMQYTTNYTLVQEWHAKDRFYTYQLCWIWE